MLASGPDGSVEIEAKAVALATGGFQASSELRARHFGQWADWVVVRGSPYCTGDGLEAALEAGAGTAGPFNRFYDHTLPAPPADDGPAQLRDRQDRLLVTLADYNAACESGNSSSLSVPKTGGLEPVMTPPFYAIRLLIGMTFTYGGVRVNSRTEVVDTSGASSRGLYAAGADVGGLYTLGYTDGLSIGLAYGKIAGKGAAAL